MRTDDGYIVGKCLEGDPAAFTLLVDKYKASVYAIAYSRLKNFHDAEDVSQEVFIKIYRKLRTLRRWDNFLSWVYSITINLCKDYLRSQSRRLDTDFIEDQSPAALQNSSLKSHQEQKLFEKFNDVLDSLPETYREVLTLYYLGGLNSVEIARIRGTTPTAIRQQLVRARGHLKEDMLKTLETAFEGQKLQAGFTFRIGEMVKNIKIQPVPRIKGMPWYISISTAIIFMILSFNPRYNLLRSLGNQSGMPINSHTELIKDAEIPIDVLRISKTTFVSESAKKEEVDMAGYFKETGSHSVIQSKQGRWIKHADMPTGRLVLSACSLNDTVYAIGGMRDGWETISKVEAYNILFGKWTRKADMPTPRYGLATAVLNGRIYAIGGVVTGAMKVLTTVEEYDPLRNVWTQKADMPTPRSGHTASVVNGKIYVIGGSGTDFISALSIVEEYDPKTDRWTRKSDMPTARMSHCSEVIDGKIYVIGGQTNLWGEHRGEFTGIVEEYDPLTDSWARKTDMPTSRAFFATGAVDGKIYVMGGVSKEYGDNALSMVDVYDTSTDKWSSGDDIPTSRFCLAGTTINGRIYAIGGLREKGVQSFTGLGTMEEYAP